MSRPCLKGQGFTRQLPNISGNDGASGRGVHAKYASNLAQYLEALSQRLRRVRVCCGDWKRVLGPSPTTAIGLTGILLDPPYGVEDRDAVYNEDSRDLSREVFAWALSMDQTPSSELPFADMRENTSFHAVGMRIVESERWVCKSRRFHSWARECDPRADLVLAALPAARPVFLV
jgi:hypothetical protein